MEKSLVLDSAVTFEVENFISAYKKDVKSFQGRSTMSCLEYILERGKAEIKRQVDTGKKTAEKNAMATLLKAHGVTSVQEAQALLALLQSQTAKSAQQGAD